MTDIRPAHAGDVCALVTLEEQVFHAEAWSRRLVTEALPCALVADGRGWVVLSVAGDVADLQRIAVAEAERGRGLGRALLAAALTLARDGGAQRVLLEVRDDNAAAQRFYAASGFVEISRRRRYYRDDADALVLEVALPT